MVKYITTSLIIFAWVTSDMIISHGGSLTMIPLYFDWESPKSQNDVRIVHLNRPVSHSWHSS